MGFDMVTKTQDTMLPWGEEASQAAIVLTEHKTGMRATVLGEGLSRELAEALLTAGSWCRRALGCWNF